ncbi:MAG: hypothetical protein ABEL97_08700 [Salinibacter sp.]
MHSPLTRWLSLLLCLGGLSAPTLAQQPDTTQQLPEIAPREIEIQGELQVSFPTLERQPLRGFASPPTAPTVPDNRTPYLAPYKQQLDSLPESLPPPQTASASLPQPAPPKSGFVQIGGGRYASRFANGHVTLPLSARQTVSVDADYFGTSGFRPFDGGASGVDTPTDQADAHVRFESRHDGLTFRATARGAGSRYTLYGEPALLRGSDRAAPGRSGLRGEVGAELRTYGRVDSRVALSYGRAAYETERPTATVAFREDRVEVDGRLTTPLAETEVHLDVSAAHSTFGGDVPDQTGYEIDGGLGATLVDTDRLTVEAGGRVLTFKAPGAPRTSAASPVEAVFIVPDGRASFSLAPGATLFAENRPTLSREGLSSLYEQNPYAIHAPPVLPTLYTTRFRTGGEVGLGPLRLRGEVGYRYAPSYRYFSSPGSGASLSDPGLQVGYASARILHGGARLALEGLRNVEAALSLSVRDGALPGADAEIPYFSPLVAEGLLSVSFADQRGLLQATGTIESPRPTQVSGGEEIDAYVTFDVEGSYQVTSLLDVVFEVRNLSPSAPERWARYPRPPTILSGGFRIHW